MPVTEVLSSGLITSTLDYELNYRSRRLQGLGLSNFQFHLTKVGGFLRVGSGHQFALFQKVAPAQLPVFRALTNFELPHGRFRILPALDHPYDSTGLIGPDVVADNGVTGSGFVACQKRSFLQPYN